MCKIWKNRVLLDRHLVSDEQLDRRDVGVEVGLDALQELNLLLGGQEADGTLRRHHQRVGQLVAEQPGLLETRLQDFSCLNIPKRGEKYQIANKLPSGHNYCQVLNIFQMAIEYTNLLRSLKNTIWQLWLERLFLKGSRL
jgi:hypothetical protein